MKAYDRILETFEKLDNDRIKAIGRLESKDFSRERKMPFKDILRYILSQKGKTTTMELNNYFKETNRREGRYFWQVQIREFGKVFCSTLTSIDFSWLSFSGGSLIL